MGEIIRMIIEDWYEGATARSAFFVFLVVLCLTVTLALVLPRTGSLTALGCGGFITLCFLVLWLGKRREER